MFFFIENIKGTYQSAYPRSLISTFDNRSHICVQPHFWCRGLTVNICHMLSGCISIDEGGGGLVFTIH